MAEGPKKDNPYAMDAYRLDGNAFAIGQTAEALENDEAIQEKKKAESEQARHHESVTGLNPHVKADIYTYDNGHQSVVVQKPGGKAYNIHSANTAHQFEVQPDGRTRTVEKSSGKYVISDLTDKGFYFDVSSYEGANEPHKAAVATGKNGTIFLVTDTEGYTSIMDAQGEVEPEAVFIRGRDGGIRTNDMEGNLVLAAPHRLPKGISPEDLKAHDKLLKAVETNPELAKSQGVPERQSTGTSFPNSVDQEAKGSLSHAVASLSEEQKATIAGNIAGLLQTAMAGMASRDARETDSSKQQGAPVSPPSTPSSEASPSKKETQHSRR